MGCANSRNRAGIRVAARLGVLGLLLGLVGNAWAQAPARVELEPLVLRTGSGGQVRAELGRIAVPENRSRRGGAMIELAFVRIQRGEQPSEVVHVFLAGGPGASGVDLARNLVRSGGDQFLEWLDGDIIGIDQRGTGLSKPNLATDVRYDFPVDVPGDRESYLAIVQARSREVAEHFRSQGIDLTAYNTAESADDVEAVRAALRYRKLVLWGRSYGSHLALSVLKRHEAVIEKVVVCSPEGPDHTFKLPSQMQNTLIRLAELLKADPALSHSIPDLPGLVAGVLDRLDREPVKVRTINPLTNQPVTVGIGGFDVQLLTAQAMGMETQMRGLPRAYLKMSRGEFEEMGKLLAVYRTRAGVGSAMKMMMDSSSFASEARLKRIEQEAGRCLLADAVNFPYPQVAGAWGNPDLGPEFRAPVKSSVPVMFICGDLDARTPPENAQELMQTLPNSVLVTVENGGHDLNMFGNPSLRGLIGSFLAGQKPASDRVRMGTFSFVPASD